MVTYRFSTRSAELSLALRRMLQSSSERDSRLTNDAGIWIPKFSVFSILIPDLGFCGRNMVGYWCGRNVIGEFGSSCYACSRIQLPGCKYEIDTFDNRRPLFGRESSCGRSFFD